jgi:hypothetical protein
MRTNTHPSDYQRPIPPRTAENDAQLERGMLHLRLCGLMGWEQAGVWEVTELPGLNAEQREARIRGQIRYLEAMQGEMYQHRGVQIARECGVPVDGDDEISNRPHWSDDPKYWAGGE